MNQEFVLGKLSELMGWDEDRSRIEFAWLRLMSRMKYDTYQDFLVGMRFIESLADGLSSSSLENARRVTSSCGRNLSSSASARCVTLLNCFIRKRFSRGWYEGLRRSRHPRVSRLGRSGRCPTVQESAPQDVVH